MLEKIFTLKLVGVVKICKKIFFFLFFVFLFFSFSFASDIRTSDSGFSFLKSIADLLNIIWLPLSIIAGKLLTNQVVYGEAFGIDIILWKMWQFSRTFANYALGFILIASIFLFFIGKVKNIFSIIGKIAIGSILINASWFIIAVLIDVSLILMVAVGSLPSSLQTERLPKLTYCKEAIIKINNPSLQSLSEGNIVQECKGTGNVDINKVYSYLNGISGPLIYIGSSILNIDKNWGISKDNVSEKTDVKKAVNLADLIHIGVIVLFVVPIFLLVLIAIIRLFWLWIYIAFSPLLILDYLFGGKYISNKNKALKLSNAIGLIFQPVLIVFALAVSLIFLLALQAAFEGNTNKKSAKEVLGICMQDKAICISENKPVIFVKGDNINKIFEMLGGFFGYLIISIMTLIVIWAMLKMVFRSSEITSGIADRVFKFAEEGFKTVPIIPTKYGAIGVGTLKRGLSKGLLKSEFDVQASNQAEVLTSKIDELFKIGKYDISLQDYSKWENEFKSAFKSVEGFEVYKKFLASLNDNIIPDSAPRFKQLNYEFWVKLFNGDEKKLAQALGIHLNKDNEHLDTEKLFNNDTFRRMLYNLIKNPNLIDKYSSKTTDPKAFIDTISKIGGTSGALSYSVKQIRGK